MFVYADDSDSEPKEELIIAEIARAIIQAKRITQYWDEATKLANEIGNSKVEAEAKAGAAWARAQKAMIITNKSPISAHCKYEMHCWKKAAFLADKVGCYDKAIAKENLHLAQLCCYAYQLRREGLVREDTMIKKKFIKREIQCWEEAAEIAKSSKRHTVESRCRIKAGLAKVKLSRIYSKQ